jgi:diaminopimelate decarboxylase
MTDPRTPAPRTDPSSASPPAPDDARTWWQQPGLEVREGRLCVAGRDAEALAREHGTPLVVYDVTRVREQVRAVQAALAETGRPYRVRFALKSQRAPEILAALRALGAPGTPESVGIDVCSPAEVLHALANGWRAEEISYTGTNVSERDLDVLLARPLHLNVDTLSQLERVGRRAPGTSLGVRINPRAGAAHHYVPVGQSADDELRFGVYSGAKPTKFGIYPEQLDDAVAIARRHSLTIDTVAFHLSHQLMSREDLANYDHALGEAAKMTARLIDAGCPIAEVNTGGGLGAPLGPGDEPLDLATWAGLIAKHFGGFGVTLASEPGEFFTKYCGTLLAEVVTAEQRMGVPFIGLDAGWNVMPTRFIWGEQLELVHATKADAPRTETVYVSGHINEAPDLFAEDYPFPPTAEGDIVAVIGAGSYCQTVHSPHCMRPFPKALFFDERV